jgi:polar amino acid transport system substrate-binding protein
MNLLKFALILCFVAIAGCKEQKKTEESTHKAVVVAVSFDNPPFEYYRDGQKVGFDVDLAEIIAKELKLDIEFKDMSFDALIGALQSGRAAFAISAITPTVERAAKVEFSEPYKTSGIVIIVGKDSPIQSATDLNDKVVGAQLGTIYETYAKQELNQVLKNFSVRSLNKIPDILQDFKAGRISAIIIGESEGMSLIKAHPDFKMILIPSTKSGYAIAMPKDSPLKRDIDAVIKKVKANGDLEKLAKKWLQG